MDISIIIVNYNTRELTLKCLESVYGNKPKKNPAEVFVVDNASGDQSAEAIAEKFPQVNLVVNLANVGFATANNQAIAQATGRYILLLNPDTIVLENCLELMLEYMGHNLEVGAAGCKVVLPDGSLDLACKRSFPTPENSFYHGVGLAKLFPKNKRFGAYNLTYLDEDETQEVDSLVGAFMLVRKEVIEQVGMLDEKYFMYGEDLDWCYRIKQAGWKVGYYPKAQIIHYKGASSKKKKGKTIYEFHRAMYLFFNDHYKQRYNIGVRALVYAGILLKLIFSTLKNIIKK